jgi:hypothetical protein
MADVHPGRDAPPASAEPAVAVGRARDDQPGTQRLRGDAGSVVVSDFNDGPAAERQGRWTDGGLPFDWPFAGGVDPWTGLGLVDDAGLRGLGLLVGGSCCWRRGGFGETQGGCAALTLRVAISRAGAGREARATRSSPMVASKVNGAECGQGARGAHLCAVGDDGRWGLAEGWCDGPCASGRWLARKQREHECGHAKVVASCTGGTEIAAEGIDVRPSNPPLQSDDPAARINSEHKGSAGLQASAYNRAAAWRGRR